MNKKNQYITKKILRPGQPGTKKYIREFGDNLICVRHRYNKVEKKKFVTAEIIVEHHEWQSDTKRIPYNKIIAIKVKYNEKHIRKMIQSVGAKWNPQKQVWQLPYHHICALGLTERIKPP